ncbi:hypothetical protein QJS04_geneDACA017399 [Acorus gramineus]|uniref:5MP1/2-like HEAT domain-containing protein n=1 Tax=Acorus gramineus TaxID=55184 RepID=A0AAV9A240_ACOGR|nr:hypothetical protein QJS04_geneDACA017399 [Acorus gramineus]
MKDKSMSSNETDLPKQWNFYAGYCLLIWRLIQVDLGILRTVESGTRIKTRKRNIAAPLDPAAFSDAVVQIYLDNAGDLELVAKSIESSDLNFSRYGDTFFEAFHVEIIIQRECPKTNKT